MPGSLLAARVGGRVPPGPLIVGGVLAGAVVMACFGLATDPWVAGAAYAATGAVWGVWNVALLSLRQAIVPDRLMGRVVGAVRMIGFGSIRSGRCSAAWSRDPLGCGPGSCSARPCWPWPPWPPPR